MATWINTQQNNYKHKKFIMKNQIIYDKWTEFIYNHKYKEYFISNEEEWYNNFDLIKRYINENNKRPSSVDKDNKIKQLGSWISAQQNNYKKKLKIMNNQKIYDIWTSFINDDKYKEYFISNEEEWHNKLESIKEYIDNNNKRPSATNRNTKIKQMGKWLSDQQTNYKKKIKIMKNEEIYNTYTNFINDDKYKDFL